MKKRKEKWKAASKSKRIIFILLTIGAIITYILFAKSLLSLVGIETTIRYIILGIFLIWIIFYLFWGVHLFSRKKTFILVSIITTLLIPLFGVSSYFIDKMYGKLENFTLKETSTYTSVLLALKDTEITNSSKLGMISNENDREGYILAKELIQKEKLEQEIISYDDFLIMLNALYNKEVDGIFLSGNYKILFGNEDNYQQIGEETKIVYSYSKEMKNEESKLTSTKKLTEPFTVLVLGVDSESQGGLNPNAAFNGDTLMLITFNPNTLSATMFSIPRDMYVPIACNGNKYNKINSAAAYGTTCVINTIKQMTDIDIDYFVKVNFKGVVDLVDALGGINVDVEAPNYDYDKAHKGLVCEQDSQRRFGENLICINPGENVHLNGEQALAYARCRHLYTLSDIARNKHQQAILEAVAKKLVHFSNFSEFEKLLDTISNNIATNMQTTQILSFYQTIKNMLINTLNGEDFITIQKTYLEYYSLPVYLPASNTTTSALGYYPNSLKAITNAMKENLGIAKPETVKTFKYDFNTDYEYSSEVIGKGIRSGNTLALMPNLSGQSVSYAENWASSHGITLHKEFIESESIPGIIVNQSIHEGTLLNSVSNVTIYISKARKDTTNNTNSKDDDDEQNNSIDSNIPGLPSDNDNKDPEDNNETDNNNKDDTETEDGSNIDIPGAP